jgi:hypothetical protein
MAPLGSTSIALCWRCRRDTLPQLAKPSWHREKHRATAEEREPAPDPRAEAIRRRKEARSLRKQIRANGLIAGARFFLSLKTPPAPMVLDEDCPECRREQLRGTSRAS